MLKYLTASTGSAVERAMVAAENANRVPLDTEEGRFKALDFVKEAMDALDKVSTRDGLTHDLVREKIGKAQARAGWQ